MANIYVDTKIIREDGKNIMQLATDLNEVLISLFNRINNMPNSTLEWTGQGAFEFVRLLNVEKMEYFKMKDILYKYGKVLIDSADEIEKKIIVSENRIDKND